MLAMNNMRLLTLHDVLTAWQKGAIGYREALERAHIDTLDELYQAASNSGVPIRADDPLQSELRRLAQTYCWDMAPQDVMSSISKVILRTMDFGTLDDIFALEATIDRDYLAAVLKNAPVGALRPRSWSFWHSRLALLVNGAPPAPPRRRVA
jgi:hypothetical protein